MRIELSGKTAFVTGGTRGIGRAIAKSFLSLGAEVIITGTKDLSDTQVRHEMENKRVHYLQGDFSDERSLDRFLMKLGEFEQIDICVNNAGINKIQAFEETSPSDYDRIHQVNLRAPYRILKTVVHKMEQNGYGRIVNIASIWSVVTRHSRSLYTASKYGLVGLTKTLAVEYAPKNILVNALSPGFIATELTMQTNSPEDIDRISQMIPIKRLAETSELVGIVAYLCSELNTYLTGQNIVVDGGYTIV